MSKYIRFLGGGDYGGVVIVRQIPVAFKEVDRCVLVAGIDAERRIGQIARHSTHGAEAQGDFWFQSAVWTKVVTENGWVEKQSGEND